MIKNKDRSGYFGASDTKFIIGNWKTKTFEKWWLKKMGLDNSHFDNKYTIAGTNYEHKIVDSLGVENIEKDKQIIIESLKLRVNLDANTLKRIYEIKTFKNEKGFDLKKHKDYVNQVQVQMYASGIHEAEIVAYGLIENDYKNYFNEIDKKRILHHEVLYDKKFIYNEFLPKLKYLADCLKKGVFPNEKDFYRHSQRNNTIAI